MLDPVRPVRVRYAPSPTGALHLGGARTALYNFLFARQRGGAFLLRIEDTDQRRYNPESEAQLREGLLWLGLRWDEGPDIGGPHAPYVQSQRLALYREAADQLVKTGAAYRCFCTPERLETMRAEQRARKEPERYDGRCSTIPPDEAARRAAAGERFVIRQRIPKTGTTTVQDLILGAVSFQNNTLDDHVLLKSDGFPTYHLAFAVDDHAMEISHIIRGVDWLPSAPKHVLLFQAFGWELPALAHLPLVLGKDRQRLAKRHGAKNVLEYRDAGYLPEAIDNFIAFLGWSPGTEEELFTLDELIQRFALERVQPSPAVANLDRLDWLNGQFIRRLSPADLAARLAERMPGVPAKRLEPLVPLVQERLRTLAEGPPMLQFFFQAPDRYDLSSLAPKGRDPASTAAALSAARTFLASLSDWSAQALDAGLREVAGAIGWTTKDFFMALRVAITGRTVTPPLIESMVQLGKDEVVARVRRAEGALTAGVGG
jgi:glutamyl-tRNA synthetase